MQNCRRCICGRLSSRTANEDALSDQAFVAPGPVIIVFWQEDSSHLKQAQRFGPFSHLSISFVLSPSLKKTARHVFREHLN